MAKQYKKKRRKDEPEISPEGKHTFRTYRAARTTAPSYPENAASRIPTTEVPAGCIPERFARLKKRTRSLIENREKLRPKRQKLKLECRTLPQER